jgi:hypothetical protein
MTKIIFAVAGATLILATPALAAERHSTTGPTIPHVYSGGFDQGTDPSPLVRLDLLRDPRSGQ